MRANRDNPLATAGDRPLFVRLTEEIHAPDASAVPKQASSTSSPLKLVHQDVELLDVVGPGFMLMVCHTLF